MPIWLELLVFLMAAYAAGLGIGWLIWGRNLSQFEESDGHD